MQQLLPISSIRKKHEQIKDSDSRFRFIGRETGRRKLWSANAFGFAKIPLIIMHLINTFFLGHSYFYPMQTGLNTESNEIIDQYQEVTRKDFTNS